MKNVLLFTLLVCSSFMMSQAGIIVPPEKVRSAFEKKYPQKTAVWSIEYGNKDDDVRFEAKFDTDAQKKGYAQFDQKGNFKFFKEQISAVKLPSNAILYLNKNYPIKAKSKIETAARNVFFVTDALKTLVYEVTVRKEMKNYKVIFDTEGNYINRVQIN
ncbi:hypothetical protein [Flavobacterium sp.]|uniref:hypothetical protein n=1 Tax=Flavobacterium sp. TaxID=239 RepID=UPI0031D12715